MNTEESIKYLKEQLRVREGFRNGTIKKVQGRRHPYGVLEYPDNPWYDIPNPNWENCIEYREKPKSYDLSFADALAALLPKKHRNIESESGIVLALNLAGKVTCRDRGAAATIDEAMNSAKWRGVG